MNTYRIAILAVATLALCGSGPHSSSSKGASSADDASSASTWSIKTNVDQMTSKKTIYAIDTAKSSTTNTYGIKYTARLALGCTPGKSDVWIELAGGEIIGGRDIVHNIHPVNIRCDENKEFTWNVSALSNGTSYAFNDPGALLGKAINAKRMLIQFTTALGSHQKVVDFDISGMNDALKKMQCHL